ncbi:MAG: ferrochelatase [Hydrogenobacter sp.]|uniref:ferrochelatase n=1 Tax=Hydrogenobacter thermophilus TaxID=940 RepID=UPI0030FB8D50
MGKVGVVLLNMGGPDSLSAVEPFLYNLFSDHDIIEIPKIIQKPVARIISKVRAKKTRHYYEIMGGRSPQREQTQKQAKALQNLLGENFKVVISMRYWHPFIEEALEELFKEDIQKIVLLPMYPQYSKTTTGSSFNEFERVFKKFPQVPVVKIKSYHDHPLYIKAMVENIKENLHNWKNYFFLFSAHSLPLRVIKSGDPYKEETEKTVKLIMKNFPGVSYALGYQSKLGPIKWLEPPTDKLLEEIISARFRHVALIPVSFVCEHSETLYELDILYGKLAKDLGVESFVRIPTLKDHPIFMEALRQLVISSIL